MAEILAGRRLVENHRVLRRITGGLNIPPKMMGLSWWGPDGTYRGPTNVYPEGVTAAGTPEGVSARMLRRHLLALGGVTLAGQPVKHLGELLELPGVAPEPVPLHRGSLRSTSQRCATSPSS